MATKTSKQKDKKITILKVTVERNSYGEEVETIAPLPGGENIWAYYRQASADEFFDALAINYKVEAVFEINWRNDLDINMLILFRGKTYRITRIDDFEGSKNDLKIYAYNLNEE